MFLASLERSGRAPGTIVKYGAVLELFVATSEGLADRSVTAAAIEAYLSRWRLEFIAIHGRPPSPATMKGQVTALRAFFAYLARMDLLQSDAGERLPNPMLALGVPRVPQRSNDWLSHDEQLRLLAAATSPDERIIISLLRWTGVRVGEAVSLRLTDVNWWSDQGAVRVRRSKTDAGLRTIPIIPDLLPELRRWHAHLTERGSDGWDRPLLSTRHGTAMKPTYVWRVVKRVAARGEVRPVACTCGSRMSRHARGCARSQSGQNLSRISPHTLRRTFATDLLNRGLRIEIVSQLLGHSSVAVTQKAYAELLAETARRELMQTLGYSTTGSLGGDATHSSEPQSSISASSRSISSADIPRSSSSHGDIAEPGIHLSYSAAA